MPTPTMLPTVGRLVLFTLDIAPLIGEIRPAIVTRIWTDNCVSLSVLTDATDSKPGGEALPAVIQRTSVVIADNVEGQAGCWHWMPFQRAQAEKAAADPVAAAPAEAPEADSEAIAAPPKKSRK